MKEFKDMNLNKNTMEFIQLNHFIHPTPVQEEVIPLVLKGKDVIGLWKTGSGKTHAYLIPIMEQISASANFCEAVVLPPTRELALQIYEMAKVMNEVDPAIRIDLFIGGRDRDEEIERLKRRQPHLVIGTPGRVKDLFLEAGVLRIDQAKMLVIDEADMMLEFGFLEDIDQVAGRMGEDLQMLAFTATLPEQLKPFIRRYMHHPITCRDKNEKEINSDVLNVLVPCYHHTFAETIRQIIPTIQPYVCLIFANSRKEVQEIATDLKEHGVDVIELRGDLQARQRERAIKEISLGKHVFVVATDLAARGIDIGKVSHVISCGFPADLKYYIHRAGRTGRAGQSGTCYALYHESDDRSIRTLMRQGIHFEHRRVHKGEWEDLRPYGQKRTRTKDDELDRQIKLVYNNKKNTKVKPGYKKKRKQTIERIYNRKKREMIRQKIQKEKKAMYKEKARREREQNDYR